MDGRMSRTPFAEKQKQNVDFGVTRSEGGGTLESCRRERPMTKGEGGVAPMYGVRAPVSRHRIWGRGKSRGATYVGVDIRSFLDSQVSARGPGAQPRSRPASTEGFHGMIPIFQRF